MVVNSERKLVEYNIILKFGRHKMWSAISWW